MIGERKRERKRERQTDRQTDRDRDSQTNTEGQREEGGGGETAKVKQ